MHAYNYVPILILQGTLPLTSQRYSSYSSGAFDYYDDSYGYYYDDRYYDDEDYYNNYYSDGYYSSYSDNFLMVNLHTYIIICKSALII